METGQTICSRAAGVAFPHCFSNIPMYKPASNKCSCPNRACLGTMRGRPANHNVLGFFVLVLPLFRPRSSPSLATSVEVPRHHAAGSAFLLHQSHDHGTCAIDCRFGVGAPNSSSRSSSPSRCRGVALGASSKALANIREAGTGPPSLLHTLHTKYPIRSLCGLLSQHVRRPDRPHASVPLGVQASRLAGCVGDCHALAEGARVSRAFAIASSISDATCARPAESWSARIMPKKDRPDLGTGLHIVAVEPTRHLENALARARTVPTLRRWLRRSPQRRIMYILLRKVVYLSPKANRGQERQ